MSAKQSKLPLGVKPTRPPPPMPPYPSSIHLVAAMSRQGGRDVMECAVCRTRPALWYCVTGRYAGYYLRCGKCGCVGLSVTTRDHARDQAAKAWNAVQTAKVKPKGGDFGPVVMPCVSCGMKPDMVRGIGATGLLYMCECRRCQVRGTECKDEWKAAWKWNDLQHEFAGKPNAGSMTINEVRQAEGLPAVKAGRTTTQDWLECRYGHEHSWFEVTPAWGITASGQHIEHPPPSEQSHRQWLCRECHLARTWRKQTGWSYEIRLPREGFIWRRFNEWMDRPSRKPKPFLKPLRKHWWQFRRPTMASFEKTMLGVV